MHVLVGEAALCFVAFDQMTWIVDYSTSICGWLLHFVLSKMVRATASEMIFLMIG